MTSIHRPKQRENAAESAADSKGDGQNACANNSPNSRFGCWTIPLTKDGTADLQANAHTSSGRSTSRRSKPTESAKENAKASRATKPLPPPSGIREAVPLFAKTGTTFPLLQRKFTQRLFKQTARFVQSISPFIVHRYHR